MVVGGRSGPTLLDTSEILKIDYSSGKLEVGPFWSTGPALSQAIGYTTVAEEISTRTLYVVSGKGHEYSLHARKALMKRAGYITSRYVRGPTVVFEEQDAEQLFAIADSFDLRIQKKS